MEVKMRKNEVKQFYMDIEETLKSDAELKSDLVYAMGKTKNKLKSIVEDIDLFIEAQQRVQRQAALKYCIKDSEGKPVVVNDRYTGLEVGMNQGYDKEIEDLLIKNIAFFKEEISVDIYTVDKEQIPTKEKAKILDTAFKFLKD